VPILPSGPMEGTGGSRSSDSDSSEAPSTWSDRQSEAGERDLEPPPGASARRREARDAEGADVLAEDPEPDFGEAAASERPPEDDVSLAPIEEEPSTALVAPEPEPRGRRHDGLYLRFGFGFGALRSHMLRQVGSDLGNDFSVAGTVSGMATMWEFALGGTPSRGLVLGGGIYTASFVVSEFRPRGWYETERGALPAEVNPAGGDLSVIGPFIDYYFKPGKGLHLQAATGLATLGTSPFGHRRGDGALGAGLMLGFGHEWWVSEEWGIGVLGRFVGGVLVQEDAGGTDWIHVMGTMPSVLLTATYH
jgi:hypothetical protein